MEYLVPLSCYGNDNMQILFCTYLLSVRRTGDLELFSSQKGKHTREQRGAGERPFPPEKVRQSFLEQEGWLVFLSGYCSCQDTRLSTEVGNSLGRLAVLSILPLYKVKKLRKKTYSKHSVGLKDCVRTEASQILLSGHYIALRGSRLWTEVRKHKFSSDLEISLEEV